MQLRHFVRENIQNFESTCERNAFLELLSLSPESKKLISKFVNYFSKDSESANCIKKAWEREINDVLPDKLWKTALSRIHSCSINSRHRLIQFKVIHRFHYSKVMLHTFYPSVSPICDKCKSNDGTLLHLFWDCPLIYQFWSRIFFFFSGVYRRTLS